MSVNPGTLWVMRSVGTSTPSAPYGATSMSWRSVTWSSSLGLFVAVGAPIGGATSKIAYSTDGVTWSLVNSPLNGSGSQMIWQKVCWSAGLGLFVAVGAPVTGSSDLGRVMTSSDGRTWTLQSTPSTGAQVIQWNNVIWVSQLALFVAVGGQISGTLALTNLIMTSPDGVTWSLQSTPGGSPSDIVWNGLAWSPY